MGVVAFVMVVAISPVDSGSSALIQLLPASLESHCRVRAVALHFGKIGGRHVG